jgi:tRNA threonylcarbamoyl adenosine modification protein (Sua5/YciO/YrdC/YwlC family)
VSEQGEQADKHDADANVSEPSSQEAKKNASAPSGNEETKASASAAEGQKSTGDVSAPAVQEEAKASASDAADRETTADVAEPSGDEATPDVSESSGGAGVTIRRYNCANLGERTSGLIDAASVIRRGELVVLPTDTVYGIGADAFTPSAVTALLAAKGRGRDMPVAVLVGTVRAANALVEGLGTYGQDLIDAFWPGPLTLICRVNRSLSWDLGDTRGTVAIRMPLHQVALELLKETGPMAVSSANRSGAPPATTAAEAEKQLGDSVSVYLDGGPCDDNAPSTILDLTTAVPRVLRKGSVPVDKLRGVIGYVATDD